MKKRGGRYCNGKNKNWPTKGQPCCNLAIAEGEDGRGYCLLHLRQGGPVRQVHKGNEVDDGEDP